MCDSCVEWGGKRWHRYRAGYYERTDKSLRPKRTLRLHRAVWEAAHGDVPPGHDIHHKDDDKGNNALDNLSCMPHGAHKAHHLARSPIPRMDWSVVPDIAVACVGCGAELRRKRVTQQPRCTSCAQAVADAKRRSDRACDWCGTSFVSRRGNYCSQRCVNLATAGATVRVLPEGRRRG